MAHFGQFFKAGANFSNQKHDFSELEQAVFKPRVNFYRPRQAIFKPRAIFFRRGAKNFQTWNKKLFKPGEEVFDLFQSQGRTAIVYSGQYLGNPTADKKHLPTESFYKKICTVKNIKTAMAFSEF